MKRIIYKNENGISPIIETLVAVGISVVLLAVFFTSANNLFTVYDTPNVDLQAKSIGIMETLLNSPGQDVAYNPSWESNYQNVSVLGLGTSQTIAYGIVHINDQDESTVISQYNFSNSSIGIAATCFLEGTKIVMADCLYKNIEDIKVGDMVKSFDEENGRLVNRRVTCVFHHAPEEMSDYYLVINDFLRITPNHLVYSNGRWIHAGDLKIGDSLFHPSFDYMVYSIEKVFEKYPTYDLEVGVSHNYFVALDTTDILVHNQDPPVARFTWFDNDGPYRSGTNISFDARDSEGAISYEWDWGDGTPNGNGLMTYHDYGNNDTHVVTLRVTNNGNQDTVTHTVQANTANPPDVDEKPWVLTGKDIYPDRTRTFVPYGKDHYIKYTRLSEAGYYLLFEIKEKTTSTYNILDFEKIENLSKVYYSVAKSALGINESESAICEFNITIVTTVNEIDVVTYTYGASHEGAYALESTAREVLVYHKPEVKEEDYNISKHPYYETGRITVCVFIGGLAPSEGQPNQPPDAPTNPDPADGATGVGRNADLSWTGGDPDVGDTVTYDVYFGTSSPPSLVVSGQSGTSYDPGVMSYNTQYYWKIVATDNHGASTEGPTWSFKTGANAPPYTPGNPDPYDGETGVDVNHDLSWTGGDPDPGDTVTYDVRFFESTGGLVPDPLPTVSYGQEDTTYDPGELQYGSNCFWQIVAYDNHSATTEGPKWSFTTEEDQPPHWLGWTGIGEYPWSVLDITACGKFQMGGTDGIANSITVYIFSDIDFGEAEITAAIYDSDFNMIPYGMTEEVYISEWGPFEDWYTLNFIGIKPELTANEWYYLAVGHTSSLGIVYDLAFFFNDIGGNGVWIDWMNPPLPDPFDGFELYPELKMSIYCSYTTDGNWLGISSADLDSYSGYSLGTLEDALDGIDRWHSYYSIEHWFILDLGQTHTITKVRGRSNGGFDPTDVDIYIDDNNPPTTLCKEGITTWKNTDDWAEITLTTEGTGSYIKVVIRATEDGTPGRITFGKNIPNSFTIFDVYGEAAGPPPPNNPPTIDSFNIDTEPGANTGWDFDNNDAQMDWTTSDEESDPVTVYITFNKGSTARLPTTADYDYHVQQDDATNKDCNWEYGTWSDYDGALHVKIRAHDGTEYSESTLTDTLANGIDGTNPTGTIDEYGTENPNSIEGDSSDVTSGVASNDITIHDTTDDDYWTGSEWGSSTWLDCTGTTTWSYDSSGVSWDSSHSITVTLRIYDSAGNVDSSADTEVFTTEAGPPGAAWLEIDSSYYYNHCGDIGSPYTLEGALDGTGLWVHLEYEVHWFILDLGESHFIEAVRGRSDEGFGDPTWVDIYVSDDLFDWGIPVAEGIDFFDSEWVEVPTDEKDGRYVKVEILETLDGPGGWLTWGCEWGDPFTIFDVYGETV